MKSFKLIVFLCILFLSNNLFAQKIGDGVVLAHFNAGWNSANEVKWLGELTDCNTNTFDIVTNPDLPKEYKIVVVPTILILEDGEEVARFQANIMMQMEATRKEVQGSIDEIIMSKF